MRDAEWGTELTRLFLYNHITSEMYAAGKWWQRTARERPERIEEAAGVSTARKTRSQLRVSEDLAPVGVVGKKLRSQNVKCNEGGPQMASKIQDLRAKLVEQRSQKAHALDVTNAEDIGKLASIHVAIKALDAVAKEETPKVETNVIG